MKVFVLSSYKNFELLHSLNGTLLKLGLEVADECTTKEDDKKWDMTDHKTVQRSIMKWLGNVYISDVILIDMTEKESDYKEYLSYLGAAYALYKTIIFVGPKGFEDKEYKAFKTFPEYHYGGVAFASDWNDALNVIMLLKQTINE